MKNFLKFLVVLVAVASISSCLKSTVAPLKNTGNGHTDSLKTTSNGSSDPLEASDTIATTQSSMAGKWSIVNDSTAIQFWGLWNGRAPAGVNYLGKSSDYYNFLSNGTLYTSENNVLDTATYVVMQHDTMQFTYPYPIWLNPAKYVVSNHTANTMTLTNAFPAVSPETISIHIINLKK